MRAIVDAGPLVAFLDRRERRHEWVVRQIEALEAPLLSCEPVLTEAMHLLSGQAKGQDALIGLVENGAIEIAFQIDEHATPLRRLMNKYRDRPMSFADACLVRMAELNERHLVMTLDSDFHVYRRSGKDAIPLIYPEQQ
jgi:predicted nucleic acid-binding protein